MSREEPEAHRASDAADASEASDCAAHEPGALARALDELELNCLVGPTASGKTEVALGLAERLGAEIVSLDSMLVYRGMDIGTAKPDAEQRARVPHHMLDLVPPSERYDVRAFLTDLARAVTELRARGSRPLFVGGTAFYLKCLLDGLFEGPPADLELRERLKAEAAEQGNEAFHARLAELDARSAARIHPNDVRRVVRALEVAIGTGRPISDWQQEWGWHGEQAGARPRRVVGLALERGALDQRIRARTHAMLRAGWPEEARRVRESDGFGPTASQALGYSEALRLADGELELDACAAEIALRTRQFARRQATWYRQFKEIEWISVEGQGLAEVLEAAARHLTP